MHASAELQRARAGVRSSVRVRALPVAAVLAEGPDHIGNRKYWYGTVAVVMAQALAAHHCILGGPCVSQVQRGVPFKVTSGPLQVQVASVSVAEVNLTVSNGPDPLTAASRRLASQAADGS